MEKHNKHQTSTEIKNMTQSQQHNLQIHRHLTEVSSRTNNLNILTLQNR